MQLLPLPSVSSTFPQKRPAETPVYFVIRGDLAPFGCASGATFLKFLLAPIQQHLFRNHQVAQGASDEQSMSGLRQPAVADFAETELPLDHAELVLYAGSDARLVSVFEAQLLGQLAIARTCGLGRVFGAGCVTRG
jgi:hypothetical protein